MPRVKVKIDALHSKELELPVYSSGAVCAVLKIEPRRLHNYLSKAYALRPTGKPGTGRGHRHWFLIEDVYRLAIAHRMFTDGFAPRFISRLLASIEDTDFFRFDENDVVSHPVIAFVRGRANPDFEQYHEKNVPAITVNGPAYYLLDVPGIVRQIDASIKELGIRKI